MIPDGLFALTFPDDTVAYFLLEIDRGTIPLTRTDVEGTAAWRKNIAYKFITYYEGWKAGRHLAHFGDHVKAFRVLTVTRSKKDRTFYAAAGAIGEIEAYADSSRAWAVAQAQRKGLYERLPGARVVTEVTRRTRPVVRWRGLDGPSGERPLSELTVRERMALLTEGPRGWSRCGCG